MRPIIKTDADIIGGWGLVPALDGDLATVTPNPTDPTAPTATTDQQTQTAATTAIVQQTLLPPPPPPNACITADGHSFSQAFYIWLLKLQQRVGGFSASPTDDAAVLAYDPYPRPTEPSHDLSFDTSPRPTPFMEWQVDPSPRPTNPEDIWPAPDVRQWVLAQHYPSDSLVVHLAGTETIIGDKTFTGLVNADEVRFTAGITPANTLGTTYWDDDSQTLATIVDATNGVTLQHGQEVMIRCVNKTGSIITDGQVVYINDAQGNRPTAALAKADDITTSMCIGVATQHIAINAEGFVTTIGLVHGYDTRAFTDGQKMYLSNVTAGLLTPTVPVSPGYLVMVATALNSTVNGSIFVHPEQPVALDVALAANSDLVSPSQKAIKTYVGHSATKGYTGFADPTSVVVTYDSTTRKVTLTGTVTAYYQGVVVPLLVSGWVSAAHDATNGTWFLFWNGTAFVWQMTTPWTFDMLMICFVNYGATYKWAIRECHGLMGWETHEEFHLTMGTYLESGGLLSGYTLASTTAAERRPGISAATVHDEDLPTVIPLLADNGPYTQLTLTGAAVNVFTAAAAEIVPVLGANPYYNSYTTPNWGQTLMANNSYMCVWCVAVPATADTGSQVYRYLWIQGQSNGTLVSQQALVFSSLNLGTLATEFTEFTAIAKVIIRYTGGNWDITSVERLLGTKVQSVTMAGSVTSVFANAPILGTGTSADPLTMSSTISVVAGATLTAGQWVNIYNNAGTANCRPADSTDATKPAQGFVLAGYASTAPATVYLVGANTLIPVGAYAAADVGKPVFLSTAGGTTLTPPTTTGNLLQQVGWVDAVGATVTVNFTNSPGIVRA